MIVKSSGVVTPNLGTDKWTLEFITLSDKTECSTAVCVCVYRRTIPLVGSDVDYKIDSILIERISPISVSRIGQSLIYLTHNNNNTTLNTTGYVLWMVR